MGLAQEIAALRDRAQADLSGAHDYYAHTQIAWETLSKAIAAGDTFTFRNVTTGTITTQTDLEGKAQLRQGAACRRRSNSSSRSSKAFSLTSCVAG